jgi:hypothetical protein
MALRWHTPLFRLGCGYGGTYFDTKHDYIYYGHEERKILVNSRWLNGCHNEGEADRCLWIKDRQSVPNIAVHRKGKSRPFAALVCDLLIISRWCNELAKDVLFLGHNSPSLREGTMLSDFGKSARSFEGENFQFFLKRLNGMKAVLEIIRPCSVYWKNFKPTRMTCTSVFDTDNMKQKFGFLEEIHLNQKIHLSFDPAATLKRESFWGFRIPLAYSIGGREEAYRVRY